MLICMHPCEGLEPGAIAFERHESGVFRDKSFDSIGQSK